MQFVFQNKSAQIQSLTRVRMSDFERFGGISGEQVVVDDTKRGGSSVAR
jgi:hypothetical protein